MNEVIDFFKDIFTTELWPARWNCGYWSSFHGWLYIGSDLAIWFSYFAIPVIILGYITRKKFELKYTTTYVLFAAFILLCGSTHLLDAAMFWTPMYKLNALVRFITGVISLFTVYHLIQILPDAFKQKTSLALEKEITRRLVIEKKLAEANEGLQAFAYMASHDLQEPLRKINVFTTNLYEANKSQMNEKSLEWIGKTIHSAERMQRMIRDILHLSSVNEQIELKPTDLNAVIRDSINDIEVKVGERSARIKTDSLPVVSGNHEYLVQVFSNLFSNSIKFSEVPPVINVTGKSANGTVIIIVQDNGIGMKQEETAKIFLPFERLHAKNTFEGSGIGLAICKKIIDVHNGTITVESSPGNGAKFTITLSGV